MSRAASIAEYEDAGAKGCGAANAVTPTATLGDEAVTFVGSVLARGYLRMLEARRGR